MRVALALLRLGVNRGKGRKILHGFGRVQIREGASRPTRLFKTVCLVVLLLCLLADSVDRFEGGMGEDLGPKSPMG